jgi:pyruvate/2-oxoglutarate dehydrogenase complex dihydrolipoamide dehydrogenase (E3) component/uncharacterized membrane protein YdjX (TVP38/TMEM64 family)
VLLALPLVAAAAAAIVLLPHGAEGLGELHQRLSELQAQRQAHPLAFAAGFFALYVSVAGLAIPADLLFSLSAGALFGLWRGALLVSFGSTLGATLAFTSSRWILAPWVRERLGSRLAVINAGVRRDGGFYLFGMRLVPLFPFFVINLAMGLTEMPIRRFYWVSQLGMFPATLIYVGAGTRLAQIHDLRSIASPSLWLTLALLGSLPLMARVLLRRVDSVRRLARWPRPRRFDRNVVVIGAGAAGLVASYVAAAAKARVTLVEAGAMGGDCLNTGCVPSKALLHVARSVHAMRHAGELGLRAAPPTVDFAAVMLRVREVIAGVAPHDSVERYTQLGVEVLRGRARITSPWTVRVDGDGGVVELSTRAIVVAAGARPLVPPIPGLEEVGYLTSDTVWGLRELPPRLLVLGGGPIGCELAQAFARLGSRVTLLEMQPRILAREDADVAAQVEAALRADGVTLLTGHKAVQAHIEGGERRMRAQGAGAEVDVAFDTLLCALGRVARTEDYGLEELGVTLRDNGTVAADAALRTNIPTIHVCGDVTGPLQFTHVAAHQAWTASVNALLGGWWSLKSDLSVIPWTTFTDPEVARVGLSEDEARARGIAFEVTRYDIAELDRAIAEGATGGFVKVLTRPGKDRILGAVIVGAHAGELLAEFVLAMRKGLGLQSILGTVHAYPTWSEAARATAGAWKRGHVSPRLLRWSEGFFAWRRG